MADGKARPVLLCREPSGRQQQHRHRGRRPFAAPTATRFSWPIRSIRSMRRCIEKLNYNFIADFAPVVRVVRSPLLMMVHPSVPAKTVPEFIAYAKANPDKISIGSGGHGSSGHMAGELFKMDAGVKMVHLPYRGESLAMTDLLGGQVQVVFATSGSVDRIRQGRHGARACRDVTRAPGWPAGRSAAGGFPAGLREVGGWSGLCAPKNTPAEIVALLNREINAAIADPRIKAARRRPGRHVARRLAGRFRQVHRRRNREVGQGGQVRGHQGRVSM